MLIALSSHFYFRIKNTHLMKFGVCCWSYVSQTGVWETGNNGDMSHAKARRCYIMPLALSQSPPMERLCENDSAETTPIRLPPDFPLLSIGGEP